MSDSVTDIVHRITYESNEDVIQSLNKAFGNQFKLLQELEAEQAKLNKLIKDGTNQDTQAVNLLNAALAKNKQQIDAITVSIGKEFAANQKLNQSVVATTRNFGNLGFAFQQILREAPSAAIGIQTFFLAISNNLPILIDQLEQTRRAGGSTTDILKTLGGAVFSLNGLITIGISALTIFGDKLFNTGKAAEQAKDEYQKFLGVLNQNAQTALRNTDEQINKLNTLLSIVKDTTLSDDQRRKGLSELQKLYPNYLKNIDLEAIGSGKAAKAIKEVQEAIAAKERASAGAKSLVAVQERERGLTNEIVKAQQELNIAQQKYNQLKNVEPRVNTLTGTTTDLRGEALNRLQAAQATLRKLQGDKETVQDSINTLQSQIIKETVLADDLAFSADKDGKDPYKRALELAEARGEYARLTDEALNSQLQTEIDINSKYMLLYKDDILQNRELTQEEREIREKEYAISQNRINNLQEQSLNNLSISLLKQKLEIAKAFKNAGDIAKFQNEIKELEVKQSKLALQASQNADVIPNLRTFSGFIPRTFKKVDTGAAEYDSTKAREDSLKDEKEYVNKIVGYYQDAANTIIGVFQQMTDARISMLDFELQVTQARITAATEIAKRGNQEVLESELASLNELSEERERLVNRQLALNTLLQASGAALAAVQALQTITNAGTTGDPYTIPLRIAAAISALAAGGAFVVGLSQLAKGFKDGGYTGNGGTSETAGVVHGQEFVITAEKTKKYRPLLEAIHNGTIEHQIPVYNYSNTMQVKGLEKRLDAVVETLNGLTFEASNNIDGNGVSQLIRTNLTRNQNRRRRG